MGDIKKRLFLVVGSDFFQRQQDIKKIKTKFITYRLPWISIYSQDIDKKSLADRLFTFSFSGDKVILFRDATNLSLSVRNFLFDNFSKIISSNYIIIEIAKNYFWWLRDKNVQKDRFFNFVINKSHLFKSSSYGRRDFSVNDFRRAVRDRDFSLAIYTLEKLFQKGIREEELSLQALGILIRELGGWAALNSQYLPLLWNGDRLIKEKGVSSRLALEILLVRLARAG